MPEMKSKIRSRKKKAQESCSDKNFTEVLSNFCSICAIRINNGMKSIDHAFKGFLIDESAAKKTSHCSLCCGMLEEFNLIEVAKAISNEIDESKYDATTFNLGLSIPKLLSPQAASVLTNINSQHLGSEISDQPLLPIKNTIKFFLLNLIEKFSLKEYDPQSKLFAKVDYCLPAPVAKTPVRKSKRRKLAENNDEEISEAEASINVYHVPIYFGGKYRKYQRDAEQFTEDIAMESIGVKLKELTRGSSVKFTSSGKEDLDVNVIGSGKPYVIEVINPKVTSFTDAELIRISNDVNDEDIKAAFYKYTDLQVVNRAALSMIKKGEEGKCKTYVAKLRSSKTITKKSMQNLNQMKDITIKQSTPLRFLHSNSTSQKENTVYEVELKKTDSSEYELEVKVSGGTHVKEFVNGDMGRTEPSLKTLLNVPSVDVVELDLMDIGIKWPPTLTEDAS